MSLSNGMWWQIIHLALGTGNYFDLSKIKFQVRLILFFRIGYYATTSTDESVYIIGGFTFDSSTGYQTPIIAEYKNDQWYNVGSLKQSRNGHGAITSGSFTMVIGGSSPDSSS